jgi:hypothetical protein
MSSHIPAAPAVAVAAAAKLQRVRDVVLAIPTSYVLGVLVAVQWSAVLALALTVRHNGWLYYAGGDQIWHYSGAFLIAHGDLPPTLVGYGWSILLLPVALVAGPNLVSALPAMVLFNTLVLLPVALLCVYGIAARIAGRLFGYFAAALWIAIPYIGILSLERGYHQKYTELTLPQALGLTSVPDFPSTVALIIGAYLCLRAVDGAGWQAAAGSGLAVGYAIAIKPSNAIFLVVPVLAFLTLRWRALLPFAVALAPPLLTLAIWKYRGLGELAAAPAESVRLASGVGDLLDRIHDPELNSWGHLNNVLLGLREHFWAARVIEWLPIAGCVALLIRSLRGFVVVGTWFLAYLVVKGTYSLASIEDASFFRLFMPGFPAYVILAAAVVLLVPGARARAPKPSSSGTGDARTLTAAVAVATLIFVVLPVGVIAGTPPLHDSGARAAQLGISLIPVSSAIDARTDTRAGAVRLSWRRQPSAGGAVFYRVFRAPGRNQGMGCAGRLNNASDNCRLYVEEIGVTRAGRFVDRPGAGTWTYRIGVAANWLDDVRYGDVYVISPPVSARL